MSRFAGTRPAIGWWVAACTLAMTVSGPWAARANEGDGRLRSVLVERGGRPVISESPDRLVSPASVLKLAIAATALHHLGPDHQATTEVYASSPPRDGVLDGDLVIQAAGDPTWNKRFFPDPRQGPVARLADAIATHGIVRVTGDLIVDGSAFPGHAQPLDRALAELSLGYAAPTSALAVDENAVRVRIAPGASVGATGTAVMLRARAAAPALRNEIRTVGRVRHDRGTVAFLPLWDRGDILVRGEYPISEPAYEMAVSVPRPSLYAGEALKRALTARGVTVAGRVRLSETSEAVLVVLARTESPPLVTWLPPILSDSHNWYAETLLRHIAHRVTGEGRIAEGLDVVTTLLTDEVGVSSDAFSLADGSGLSADNLISARAIVALLTWAARQPWRASFVAALAGPGRGTLAAWGPAPSMAAKTGSRRHAVALAGYLDPAAAEPVVFAFLMDHLVESRATVRRQIIERLRDVSAATQPMRGD